jgi:hypothetical protein
VGVWVSDRGRGSLIPRQELLPRPYGAMRCSAVGYSCRTILVRSKSAVEKSFFFSDDRDNKPTYTKLPGSSSRQLGRLEYNLFCRVVLSRQSRGEGKRTGSRRRGSEGKLEMLS